MVGVVTTVSDWCPRMLSLAKRLGVMVAALPELALPTDTPVSLRLRVLPFTEGGSDRKGSSSSVDDSRDDSDELDGRWFSFGDAVWEEEDLKSGVLRAEWYWSKKEEDGVWYIDSVLVAVVVAVPM